jgi:SAM-dependent methyltransferase
MRPDVVDLRAFYASPLGAVARRLVRRQVRAFWPDVSSLRVLGLGYATPFLRPFRDEAERVLAFMPAGQGVVHWPDDAPGLVALAEDDRLPLPDASVDRVLVVHGLEVADQVAATLREIWRVLTPAGRLIVVVPNRSGLWARREGTPFAQGRPFFSRQLTQALRDSLFNPTRWAGALHLPPSDRPVILRAASGIETLGARWWPGFAGVHVVEASKQIYAVDGYLRAARARQLRPSRVPVAVPAGFRQQPETAGVSGLAQQEHGLLAKEIGKAG